MARRKRLTPTSLATGSGRQEETNSHVSDAFEGSAPEVKSALRPANAFGAEPPIARVAAETAAEAALNEISEAMTRAREEGRLILRLPLRQVEADHLVRDRIGLDEEELSGLMASIREHGQRSPVEVTEIAPGRYGLISGWRRLTALRRLTEAGEDRFSHVLALVRKPDSSADAYIAMVEENEIRLGLSYYERARIAARTVEQGVFPSEREALRRLFANASRSRRSKIGSFMVLYQHFETVLRFPEAIPERLGLALEKRLQELDSAITETFIEEMAKAPPPDAASEIARLQAFASPEQSPPEQRQKPERENVSRAKHSEPSGKQQYGSSEGADLMAAGRRHEVSPGLFLEAGEVGGLSALILSGSAVDPQFRAKLEAWLFAQARPG